MKLPVLLYHKVSVNHFDALTVTIEQLDRQLSYLVSEGYQCVTAKQILDYHHFQTPLPNKPILITFDDAHFSFYEHALTILKKHKIKVTLFIATGLIGTEHSECGEIMSHDQIKKLDFNIVEPALHSHRHQNYKKLTPENIKYDLQENISVLKKNDIPFAPVFAYPFGGFPREFNQLQNLKELFSEFNIEAAFRIGNRINHLSGKTDFFQLNRIDVRGTDSFFRFKLKLKFGKIL